MITIEHVTTALITVVVCSALLVFLIKAYYCWEKRHEAKKKNKTWKIQ